MRRKQGKGSAPLRRPRAAGCFHPGAPRVLPQPGVVQRLVVAEGMKVVLTGIGIGTLGALGVGQALSRMVYGIPVRDPATFAGVVVALTIIAFTACFIPARRAAVGFWDIAADLREARLNEAASRQTHSRARGPSAAQTARAVFPHAAFTKTRDLRCKEKWLADREFLRPSGSYTATGKAFDCTPGADSLPAGLHEKELRIAVSPTPGLPVACTTRLSRARAGARTHSCDRD
jgi:hypothetical protein